MSKCKNGRGLCPVSFGLASGLACGFGVIIMTFIGAYVMGVNPPAVNLFKMFLQGFVPGVIIGLLVGLFYNLFVCICKKLCSRCCGNSCEKCNCGSSNCSSCNPQKAA